MAVEDAARYRDALGVPLPQGLPDALLVAQPQALRDLVSRYARTHGPFTTEEVAARFGLGRSTADLALKALQAEGRLLEGEFRPGGQQQEWCDSSVLTAIRRRSLAKLRHEVEPVELPVLGRLLTQWQGVTRPRRGLDALLDVVETLQGLPLAASILEREILPARLERYQPSDLDALISAGEVVWAGVEPLGERDGRIALFLTDHVGVAVAWRAPAALARGSVGTRAGHPRCARRARRAVLRRAAGGGRRRLPAGHRRCDLEPGLARPDHERHAAAAAGAGGQRSDARSAAGRRAGPSDRVAWRRRPPRADGHGSRRGPRRTRRPGARPWVSNC